MIESSKEFFARLAYIDLQARVRLGGMGFELARSQVYLRYIQGKPYVTWNGNLTNTRVFVARYPIPDTHVQMIYRIAALDPELVAQRLAVAARSLLEAHQRMLADDPTWTPAGS